MQKELAKKRMLFIFNPYSGKQELKSFLPEIIDLFVKENFIIEIRTTQSKGDARNVIKSSRENGYDLILCSGGDGTLNEAVSGLMEGSLSTKLGYIPSGTVNDFASSLGISSDIMTAARDVLDGNVFACDVGQFCDDKFFSYIAAFGAFTDVSYQTPQNFKNIFGRAAYVLEGIKQLPSIKKQRLSFKAKGFLNEEKIEDDFIFGMVSNSTSVAGIKSNTKGSILMDDGLLEALFVKYPKNAIELQLLLNDVLTQNFSSKLFYSFKTDQLSFSSNEKIRWTLDGEFGGEISSGKIGVLKRKLQIIIGNK